MSENVAGGENVTEGEFQEFLITVGYRYNSKTKMGFNTFEGFHAMIGFYSVENRYTLSLGADADNLTALFEKIKAFAGQNKAFVSKAGYKDRQIRMNIKMTVDSDIDREHLKEITRFVTELCKSGIITPLCRICSKNKKTGMYIIGSELMPVCDKCIERKRKQYERRRDMFEKKKQNMPAGIGGAVFGAILGASVYVLLYQFWTGFGIWAGIIVSCIFGGYVVAGKRATKLSAVICEIIAGITLLAAEYTAMVANMAISIERNGGGIAVTEAIESTNSTFSDYSILNAFVMEVLIGIGVMVVIGIIYFLKRKFTRPSKISKNLL